MGFCHYHLGSICHFSVLKAGRSEEAADSTVHKPLLQRNEICQWEVWRKSGWGEEVGEKRASSWSFCFFEGETEDWKSIFIFLENLIGPPDTWQASFWITPPPHTPFLLSFIMLIFLKGPGQFFRRMTWYLHLSVCFLIKFRFNFFLSRILPEGWSGSIE